VVLQHAPLSVSSTEFYALALAHLANTFRVIGDLPRADQILFDARFMHRAQAGGDRRVRAEIDSLEGSLRRGQGRLGESISVLLRALMTFHQMEGGNSEAEAACLMKLSRSHGERGDHARAIEISSKLYRHPALQTNDRLQRLGKLNLVAFLRMSGRLHEAWEVIEEIRPLFGVDEYPLERLRVSWAEASTLHAMGERETAEKILLAVRAAFEAVELRYDQALASMTLAEWYLGEHRYREARPFVEEALPIFGRLELTKKMRAARQLRTRVLASE